MEKSMDIKELMARHGVEVIGASQRVIAYASVASGGSGLLNIIAAGHGLKKHETIYLAAGAYAGIHKVKKVIDNNTIQITGIFGATEAGNINLTASLYGHGFIVNESTGLVIAEFEPDDRTIDPVMITAKKYTDSEIVQIPFKKIRITAGNITCVRKTPPTDLPYSNR